MILESALFTKPTREWKTRQAVIFDWYDGPRTGVASLEAPAYEFHFHLLSEKATDDDLDDRLFRVSELPVGSVSQILKAVQGLGEPATTTWAPVWRFPSEKERIAAELEIERLLAKKRETDIVIWTRDMREFLGAWHAERNGTPEANWFTKLGIAT
jgi:hypothetical protein